MLLNKLARLRQRVALTGSWRSGALTVRLGAGEEGVDGPLLHYEWALGVPFLAGAGVEFSDPTQSALGHIAFAGAHVSARAQQVLPFTLPLAAVPEGETRRVTADLVTGPVLFMLSWWGNDARNKLVFSPVEAIVSRPLYSQKRLEAPISLQFEMPEATYEVICTIVEVTRSRAGLLGAFWSQTKTVMVDIQPLAPIPLPSEGWFGSLVPASTVDEALAWLRAWIMEKRGTWKPGADLVPEPEEDGPEP